MKLKLLPLIGVLFSGVSCKSIYLDTAELNGTSSAPTVSFTPPNAAPGEEWVEVPANAGGMGLPVFYVMKYEAKAMLNDESASSATGTDATTATHKPVSTADNLPWREINANDAAAECESLGSDYHLISNPEWMAIARDIENQAINWTGGSVGSGCMFRGNSGETTTGDGTNVSDSCGYGDTLHVEGGSGRDLRAKHTLSNGQEIFDLSGNLTEWTDWDKDTVGFQTAPDTSACTWGELPSISCGVLVDADYNTSNGGYTRTEGAGALVVSSQGAALRGAGYWFSPTYAGIFRLDLANDASATYGDSGPPTGFRCVYRP